MFCFLTVHLNPQREGQVMEETDKARFAQVMHYLALNFPERAVGRHLLHSYFADLSGYAIDEIERAAKTFVQTGVRFPFVSDFVRILEGAAAGPDSPPLAIVKEVLSGGPLSPERGSQP
jgi:hypothetical protein